MWLILKKGTLNHFNIKSRIFPLKKLNVFIGANDSGKSYFMRELMNSVIGVKTTEELLDEIKANIESLTTFAYFPFEIFEIFEDNPNIKNLVKVRELFNTDFFIKSERKHNPHPNIGFEILKTVSNEEKAREHIEYIREISNGLSFEINLKWDYKNIEFLENEIHPKFTAAVIKWLKRDFIKLIEDNQNYLPEITKLFEMNPNFFDEIQDIYSQTMKIIQIGTVENPEFDDERNKIFIPVSRTTRHPGKNAASSEEKGFTYDENSYKDRVVSEYNIQENYIDVFTGVDLYQRYKTALLGTQKEREKIKALENFLSNHFFANKKISIIPDERTYELKIHIEGDEDKPLYKVGDGISSLIILFFALKIESKYFVFIEEPEQNLHAGFQRLVSLLLGDKSLFKDKYIFITTHSNHIIDASIATGSDRNLYSITKSSNKFNVKLEKEGSTLFLEELGVLPSSVFLANKAIWVEGKYDALFIRSLLEMKYREKEDNGIYKNKRYIEGVDYVFVPYAGSNRALIDFKKYENIVFDDINLEKILEAVKLTKDYVFIMDDDGLIAGKEGKKKEFYQKIQNDIGPDKVHKLQAMEIENLASIEVVINYAKSQIRMSKEKIKHYNKEYTKENIEDKLEEVISEKDYRNQKLYDYLNDIVKINFGKSNLTKITGSKGGYKSHYSLKNKEQFYKEFRDFCNESDLTKLTESAKNLLNFVYDFISGELKIVGSK